MLEIRQIPALSDNYIYLAHDPATGATAVVDPATTKGVFEAAEAEGWTITHILNTHHHPDHVGGNMEIKERTGCTVVGPKPDAGRIPGIDVEVDEGDTYTLGEQKAQVFFVPGHTSGHIAFYFADSKALFCGDTLFAMGCGRLFEGTPEQMWDSLKKLLALPDETLVYCAHEYTQANAAFAVTVEPQNEALQARKKQVDEMRAEGQRTVPSKLGEERRTNPFLRPDSEMIRETLGMMQADEVEVFAEVRRRKDNF
ncbi:MAG: hydroxyacylglutathione hydrolase [Alphaproteobacteria bacterium]|nr:hydroxyacylglutathione hydrolase [Alphaproteobacteria bacterium]